MEVFGKFRIEIDVDVNVGCFQTDIEMGKRSLEHTRKDIERIAIDVSPILVEKLSELDLEHVWSLESEDIRVFLTTKYKDVEL